MLLVRSFFFFFQAEDGIRDYKVTGVQTCALPISWPCEMRYSRSSSCGQRARLNGIAPSNPLIPRIFIHRPFDHSPEEGVARSVRDGFGCRPLKTQRCVDATGVGYVSRRGKCRGVVTGSKGRFACRLARLDRKSTRLNSSHLVMSYAVFCLKKTNFASLN